MSDIKSIASMIDHTLLKADATAAQIRDLCSQAREMCFASVCLNPCFVKLAAGELENTGVKVCTVIGFPLGAAITAVKVYETLKAVKDGAQEIDMVINIGALKAGDHSYVENEIKAVVTAAAEAPVKVIIETCYLTDEEKEIACQLAKNAGAGFVKTSTGYGSSGAAAEDVALMRRVVGNTMGVKASGGIRCLKDARAMIEAGASRLGTSSGVSILDELAHVDFEREA